MLDTEPAARRAPPAGNGKGIRSPNQRRAVYVQRQEVVARQRQVVQAVDQWAVGVDRDLRAIAPDETGDRLKGTS